MISSCTLSTKKETNKFWIVIDSFPSYLFVANILKKLFLTELFNTWWKTICLIQISQVSCLAILAYINLFQLPMKNILYKYILLGVQFFVPLFFQIYINDLSGKLETNVKLFADDTLMFSVVSDPINTSQKLKLVFGPIN